MLCLIYNNFLNLKYLIVDMNVMEVVRMLYCDWKILVEGLIRWGLSGYVVNFDVGIE